MSFKNIKKPEYYTTFEFLNHCNQTTFFKNALQAKFWIQNTKLFFVFIFWLWIRVYLYILTKMTKFTSVFKISTFFSIFKFFGNSAPHLWHICRLYFLCKRTWVLFPTCLEITLSISFTGLHNIDYVISKTYFEIKR